MALGLRLIGWGIRFLAKKAGNPNALLNGESEFTYLDGEAGGGVKFNV
jgi:hypothetical protein